MQSAPPTVARPLSQLLEKVDNELLILPEIQRDFIWQRRSVMMLFDSLFRGLPIGHMLVWKAKRSVRTKPFYGRKRHDIPLDNFYGYLLDGQQRLTALQRVRDADDEYPLMFYARPDRQADETFVWQRNHYKSNPWYVLVSEVLHKGFDILAYLRDIKKSEDYEPAFERRIDDDLRRLKGVLDYTVGVIEFETDSYKEATELFIRFNSTGKRLSKSDLFLAELAVAVPGLATTDIQRAAQKYPGFGFTMPFLTQCLLAVCTSRLQTKARRAWEGREPREIKEAWSRTERGVGRVITLLTGAVGWQSSDLIPSFNALIPLIFIAAKNGGITASEAEIARRWLLLTGVRSHFSGSVHTEIDRILRYLGDAPSVRRLWKATSRSLRKLRPSDFELSRVSGPVTSLYVSMLADNDARDWCDHLFRLNGTVTGHNAQLQVHHFFPKSLLKKHGRGEDVINTFGNYTLLSASANLKVGAEEPATYMKRVNVSERELNKQCIPTNRDLWHLDRYDDFLKERRRLLADAANKFLGC